MVLTSNDKGNIAEAAITLEAIKLGIDVLKPIAEHGRYDLVFDLGDRFSEFSANGAPTNASWASSLSGLVDHGTRPADISGARTLPVRSTQWRSIAGNLRRPS